VLERLGPDQGPVQPGFPGPRGADVIEVLTGCLDKAVGGSGDLLVSSRIEQQPQRLARFIDVAGHPVSDQPLGGLGNELGDEQLPLRGADGDGQQLAGQVAVAAHLGLRAGHGAAGFLDAGPPA